MAQVSSKKIKKEVLLKIADLLVAHIASVRTSTGARSFIQELFTETEQIMFAKRFAVIIMLKDGYNYQQIQKNLGVSSSTVARLWKSTVRGDFDTLLKQCTPHARRTKSSEKLEGMIETIVRGGLPPMGRGRWKGVYEKTKK